MRVTPVADIRIQPQVLIANIVATDPGHMPVDNDDLAVIAEVELEAVAAPLSGIESGNLHASLAQLATQPRAVKIAAAYFIVEQVYADTGARLVRQDPADAPAQVVVANNVRLKQDVVLGGFQAAENTVEGLLAINQQLDSIAPRCRYTREVEEGVVDGFGGRAENQMFGHLGSCLLQQLAGFLLHGIALFQITVELGAPEYQIAGHCKIGYREQGNGPGDGTLRRAYVDDGLDGRDDTQCIEQDHRNGDDLGVHFQPQTAYPAPASKWRRRFWMSLEVSCRPSRTYASKVPQRATISSNPACSQRVSTLSIVSTVDAAASPLNTRSSISSWLRASSDGSRLAK